jgi:cation-transporting P-type ATPase 13A2
VLGEYAHQGYRVIAVAGRALGDNVHWSQLAGLMSEQVESDLELLGLTAFENKLKPTTAPVIDTLARANIQQAMCTGTARTLLGTPARPPARASR